MEHIERAWGQPLVLDFARPSRHLPVDAEYSRRWKSPLVEAICSQCFGEPTKAG